MPVVKRQTLPILVNMIRDRGYTEIKVERKSVAFNIPQLDVLTEDETHDVFMQWLSRMFVFGYIKGVRYEKGRARTWVYFTTHYDSYA